MSGEDLGWYRTTDPDRYALAPVGQRDLIRDVVATVRRQPNGAWQWVIDPYAGACFTAELAMAAAKEKAVRALGEPLMLQFMPAMRRWLAGKTAGSALG